MTKRSAYPKKIKNLASRSLWGTVIWCVPAFFPDVFRRLLAGTTSEFLEIFVIEGFLTMLSGFTYRRGRTYHQKGAADSGGCAGFLLVLMIGVIIVGIPSYEIVSERRLALSLASFTEVLTGGVFPLSARPIPGTVVSAQSRGPIRAVVYDEEFGVTLDGALSLRRQTEYCQWQEHSHQRCETCRRTVRAKDGTSSSESHSCNCVTEYTYEKSWRRYRVPSMAFDQPANHFNPQRDPYPSASWFAPEAWFILDELAPASGTAVRLGTSMLDGGVRSSWRGVEWVRGGDTVEAREAKLWWWQRWRRRPRSIATTGTSKRSRG